MVERITFTGEVGYNRHDEVVARVHSSKIVAFNDGVGGPFIVGMTPEELETKIKEMSSIKGLGRGIATKSLNACLAARESISEFILQEYGYHVEM